MKKLLAMLLSLTLVCSCTFAFAETTPIPQETAPVMMGLENTISLSVNGEKIAQLIPMLTGTTADESTMTVVNAFVSLLEKASISARLQENGGKLSVAVNGTDVLDAALTTKDDKVLFSSSLLPSYTLDLTTAAQQIIEQVGKVVSYINENQEAITALVQALTTEYMTAITGMIGEPQTVEITDGEITYVTATPLTMTMGQVGDVYLKMLDILLADEFVKSLVASMNLPADDIAAVRAQIEAIAALKGTENDKTLVTGMVYMTEDQTHVLVDATIAAETGSTTAADGAVTVNHAYMHYVIAVAAMGENAQIDMEMTAANALPEENDWSKLDAANVTAKINYAISATKDGFSGSMVSTAQGMQFGADFNETIDMTEGLNNTLTMGLYFLDMSAPIVTFTANSKTVPAEVIEIADGTTVLDRCGRAAFRKQQPISE